MSILFFVGVAIILGYFGGRISHRFKSPAVVGYLLIGLILGPSGFNFLHLDLLERLGVFNDLALGVVAFIIGSEIRLTTLR
jgi:Kef-type K+ transport system membrane component KefB